MGRTSGTASQKARKLRRKAARGKGNGGTKGGKTPVTGATGYDRKT